MNENNKKTLDKILRISLAVILLIYLGFYYIRTNPTFKTKFARDITLFANSKLTANGIYSKSNLILKLSLAINPDDAFTYQVLGYNYYQLAYKYVHKDKIKTFYLKKAFTYNEKALSYAPKHHEIVDNIGLCYILDEKFDKAIEMFNRSLKIKPDDSLAVQELAVIYSYYKIDYPKALKYMETYMKLQPNNINAYFSKAWILSALDRNKEAIEYYNKYLEHFPYSVAALVNITGCAIDIKDYENALKYLERGLALNRHSYYLLSHKIDILANMKKYDEAKTVARELIDNSQYYGAHLGYFRLAKIQQIEGNSTEAEANFKLAKETAEEFLNGEYCKGKDYDLNDNDARCRNIGLFLKKFDEKKNSKDFYFD